MQKMDCYGSASKPWDEVLRVQSENAVEEIREHHLNVASAPAAPRPPRFLRMTPNAA